MCRFRLASTENSLLCQHHDRLFFRGFVNEVVVRDDSLPSSIVTRFPRRCTLCDCSSLGHEISEAIEDQHGGRKFLGKCRQLVRIPDS